jgi:hypothetical protein
VHWKNNCRSYGQGKSHLQTIERALTTLSSSPEDFVSGAGAEHVRQENLYNYIKLGWPFFPVNTSPRTDK